MFTCDALQEQSGEGLERRFERLRGDLEDRHRFLLRSLTNKSLKIGAKSGLQDLVMLLNFNNFYVTA